MSKGKKSNILYPNSFFFLFGNLSGAGWTSSSSFFPLLTSIFMFCSGFSISTLFKLILFWRFHSRKKFFSWRWLAGTRERARFIYVWIGFGTIENNLYATSIIKNINLFYSSIVRSIFKRRMKTGCIFSKICILDVLYNLIGHSEHS